MHAKGIFVYIYKINACFKYIISKNFCYLTLIRFVGASGKLPPVICQQMIFHIKNKYRIYGLTIISAGDQWSPLQNEPVNELQENNHLIGVIYNRPFIYILYIIHKKTALNSMLLTIY